MPRVTRFLNNGLEMNLEADSSKSRQVCPVLDSLRTDLALQLLQALAQKAGLGRVADGAAFEQAAKENPRRCELVHVLEDEDFHLPRPERHVGGLRIAIDGRSISAGKAEIVQAMLGKDRGVRKPGPAMVGVGEKLSIDELECRPAARRIRVLRIDASGGEKRIFAARVQLEDRL